MKVADMMSIRVMSVPKKTPLDDIISMMADNKKSCVLVTEKEKLIGVITERDLTKKVLFKGKSTRKLTAQDVMTRDPITISPGADLSEASTVMHNSNIRHLPVIEKGRLKGLLTQTDIVRETHKIHKKNVSFSRYQNIQSAIIIIFFIYLALYLLYRYLRSIGFFS